MVVVGGGFAGLAAVRALRRAPADVLLLDERNHHLFQPLLYQVATASLSPAHIAAAFRQALARQENVTIRMERVERVDPVRRLVVTATAAVHYDALVLAPGVVSAWFGHDEWSAHALPLKTLADAVRIRGRILSAYEAAEREQDVVRRTRLLTFVIVGAGPTGVELAGALAEMAHHTLRGQFRTFDPSDTRVLLLDAAPRVLPTFPLALSRAAGDRLAALGVLVRCEERVMAVDGSGLVTARGRIDAGTVIWAAGVRGGALLTTLGVPLRADGRLEVSADLSVPGHPEVFVAGDAAAVPAGANWVPATAPPALQMGRHAASNVRRRLQGRQTTVFRYRDRGELAVIGRGAAVAGLGRLQAQGMTAWLLWVVVHITYLVGFRSRLGVMLEWAWAYVTHQRGARVIIEEGSGCEPEARSGGRAHP